MGLGEINLLNNGNQYQSGAAFLLNQQCKHSSSIIVDHDWQVVIEKRNPYLIVWGPNSFKKDLLDITYEKAQKGLDLFSIKNLGNYSLQKSQETYLLWWTENESKILRLLDVIDINFAVNGSVVIVKDGNVVPDPIPLEQYHPALRYFRLSQTSDDMFDAYRNLWLSFELLISYVYPKQSKEREYDWLIRALKSIDLKYQLPAFSKQPKNPKDIIARLYTDARLPLFHAKDSQLHYIPQNLTNRTAILEALNELSRIVIFLSEKVLDFHRPAGGITKFAFDNTIVSMLKQARIIIPPKSINSDPPELLKDIFWENALTIPTRYAPDYSQAGRQFIFGEIDTAIISKIRKIKTFGLRDETDLMASYSTEAEIVVEGFDKVEILLGTQLVNIQQPKQFYKT